MSEDKNIFADDDICEETILEISNNKGEDDDDE